ncbi:MAG: phosphatidate cytidylyltransferase [Oscillospiraceae bacterium]|nr:phosphatidate cytidylyltransferase [Oscillospiraceae bacterium]
MKTRVIAAMVMVPLLCIAVFALPKVATAILFGAMAALAVYELLYRTELVRHGRMIAYSMVTAFLVPVWCWAELQEGWGLLVVLLFVAALFGEMMNSHIKVPFEHLAYCMVAGLLIPYLFSSIVRIHNGDLGDRVVIIPFILAFSSDTGAYFTGRFFGNHKLAPVISPKKTVEGAIGGVIAAVVGMLIYGIVMKLGFKMQVNFGYAVIYGLAGSVAGVFGDLCFSVIKRQTGIKDYGNLIPGHGGILDRFDSMMLVGPLSEALILLLPVIGV